MITVAALIGPAWSAHIGWERLASDAVLTAVRVGGRLAIEDAPSCFEVSVKFADDDEVRALNGSYRGKDAPTNVLSFPMMSAAELARPPAQGGLLGDIILAAGVCAAEAAEKSIALADHTGHLIVHGTLHLLGHDHQADDEAAAMKDHERRALDRIGIADPYAQIDV